jgi:Uma2 family endonuclease
MIKKFEKQRKTIPPLENGDRLDQKTFHERYEAMPPGTRAELIGGRVFMGSPLERPHGRAHLELGRLLGDYVEATPGTEGFDNATTILGEESEPQPDLCLLIARGGQTRDEDEYIAGAPELIAEVASSTESVDLNDKRADYEHAGVREYLVVALRQQRAIWFVLRRGKFKEMKPGSDGILRSEVFPGLWLDPVAFLQADSKRVREVLNRGLASPEHAAFVAKLAAAK